MLNVKYLIKRVLLVIVGLAMLLLSISVWAKPYGDAKSADSMVLIPYIDTAEVVILSGDNEEIDQSLSIDTAAINAAFLCEMRRNGQLLSSDEYASRISNYYNTLVATLTALFVLFTLVTYFTIKGQFERLFDEKSKEIEENCNEKILSELSKMVNDSRRFQEIVDSAVALKVEDNFVIHEEFDVATENIDKLISRINETCITLDDVKKKQHGIYKVVEELQDSIASKMEIEDNSLGAVTESDN